MSAVLRLSPSLIKHHSVSLVLTQSTGNHNAKRDIQGGYEQKVENILSMESYFINKLRVHRDLELLRDSQTKPPNVNREIRQVI